jgi:hypothetical protein
MAEIWGSEEKANEKGLRLFNSRLEYKTKEMSSLGIMAVIENQEEMDAKTQGRYLNQVRTWYH